MQRIHLRIMERGTQGVRFENNTIARKETHMANRVELITGGTVLLITAGTVLSDKTKQRLREAVVTVDVVIPAFNEGVKSWTNAL